MIALSALQLLAIVAFAPLMHGAMKLLRARLQGRPGPSALQPYRDLAKLWRKESIVPDGVSPIAIAAPGVALGVALTLAAALPLAVPGIPPLGEIIALIFLLALSRFALGLAALDSRSAFAGMAASREQTIAALVEPTLLVALLGAAALGRGTQLPAIMHVPFGLAGLLAIGAFFLVLLAETARVPIDNQETHYELTMIHEGLSLEFSGWQLAFVQAASYVRQLSFLLLAGLLLPGGTVWALVTWAVALAALITVVETLFAKVRLFEVPQLLASAFVLAAASIALRLLGATL
ncbi:MAG TPA: NADH-quinone oxidoreductase subunit H [Candidatus Baltobacteraceae bacterium]|jgi:formate hydrogenlyase subunit 4|nr:NADH-quinone oxidoreductase subunit H [Candidatus Baltobacteraceae bacterium]